MENRCLLKQIDNKYVISPREETSFAIDLSNKQGLVSIEIQNNVNAKLLLLNPKEDVEVEINVLDNAYLQVSMLDSVATKNIKISANVGYKSTFSAYFADFIPGKCKGDIAINLNKEYATCEWHLASLSMKQDNKEFNVSAYHNAVNTYAQMDNYGVCRDSGKLVFSGICHIINGSHGSKAHQNAKIMVFDELSNGVAKPILKIDENDIEASHAAIVGKINDDHIFYLTSRGLTEEEAKRIITLGYLKPILHGFEDEDIKEEIENLIEGKM